MKTVHTGYIHFENGGWTGTEHYTCIIHDRPSMYSKLVHSTMNKYNIKVGHQKLKTKVDSKN